MNGKYSREKNGNCACAEGYIARYGADGTTIQGFEPTKLYVHDCEYIQLRNSKIKRAEAVAEQRGITFLQAMDYLMGGPRGIQL